MLRRRDVRETDRLYTIFTKTHGKIEAIARGSRKPTSKLSPHLESFATVDLLVARGRFWDHVAGSEIVERFSGIGSKFWATWAAFYVFELTDALTKPGARDFGLWNLLLEYTRALNELQGTASVADLKRLTRAYSCQLLLRLGIAPELQRCQNCKTFSVDGCELGSSGLFCASCAAMAKREQSILISRGALSELRAYHKDPLNSFLNRFDRRDGEKDASLAVEFLLRSHLGVPLKSEKVFITA